MTVQPPSLLVVDDEQGILDVVGRFARRAGFEVVACPGGHEAIAQLRTRQADVAMVDLRMPDISGLDVLRQIRDIDPGASDPHDRLCRRSTARSKRSSSARSTT